MGIPASAGTGLRVSARPRASVATLVGLALALGAGSAADVCAQGRTHVLIVVGLGGTEDYRARFHEQATRLRNALTERHGLPVEAVTYLGERPDEAPGIVDDRSTRANVLKVLGEISQRAGPEDRVLVVLIGHGTSGRDETRFNLPVPTRTPPTFRWGPWRCDP